MLKHVGNTYEGLVHEYQQDITHLHGLLLSYSACNQAITRQQAQEMTAAYMENRAPIGSLRDKAFWANMREMASKSFASRFARQLDPKSLIDHIINNTANNVYAIMELRRGARQQARALAVLEERPDAPAHQNLKILPPVLESAIESALRLKDQIPPEERDNFDKFQLILKDMLAATHKANETRNRIREKLDLGPAPPGISLDEINFNLPSFAHDLQT